MGPEESKFPWLERRKASTFNHKQINPLVFRISCIYDKFTWVEKRHGT